jgi:hypothetical protein
MSIVGRWECREEEEGRREKKCVESTVEAPRLRFQVDGGREKRLGVGVGLLVLYCTVVRWVRRPDLLDFAGGRGDPRLKLGLPFLLRKSQSINKYCNILILVGSHPSVPSLTVHFSNGFDPCLSRLFPSIFFCSSFFPGLFLVKKERVDNYTGGPV